MTFKQLVISLLVIAICKWPAALGCTQGTSSNTVQQAYQNVYDGVEASLQVLKREGTKILSKNVESHSDELKEIIDTYEAHNAIPGDMALQGVLDDIDFHACTLIKNNLDVNDTFSCDNHTTLTDLKLALDMTSIMKEAQGALINSREESFSFCYDVWLANLPCDSMNHVQPLIDDLVGICHE